MAQSKAKPLSFSTTIRNPERIPNFLRCILPFEGKILTSDIIHEVVKNVIREKEYTPMYISKNPTLKRILLDEDSYYSDAQLEEIIENSPQKHKEAGFDSGWDSRFDTWYKLMKELGFIRYAMNKPIVITPTGHMLVEAYMEEPCNEVKIQRVFLNALMRYQTNNPLRKNLNENAPLPLLLKVITLLQADSEENNAGIAKHELPILICWRDNNAYALYEHIKNIRKKYRYSPSEETIYNMCLSILECDNRKYLKIEKICHEAVDEYIRKMRMSGLLSLRGNGRFLDINHFENELIDYVVANYMDYPKYDTEDDYIDYMGTIDNTILQIETSIPSEYADIRKRTLYKYAKDNTKEFIKKELLTVCGRHESRDDLLKFMNGPTRLEFLTSVALVQNFEGLDVNPNYAVDDEGMPTHTASGGMADIECYDTDYDSYFEVTLMQGRSDQVNNEIIPISRHLKEAKEKKREKSFSVLVAPTIHQDTKEAAAWQKHRNNIDILTYDINEFIDALKCNDHVSSLLVNTI